MSTLCHVYFTCKTTLILILIWSFLNPVPFWNGWWWCYLLFQLDPLFTAWVIVSPHYPIPFSHLNTYTPYTLFFFFLSIRLNTQTRDKRTRTEQQSHRVVQSNREIDSLSFRLLDMLPERESLSFQLFNWSRCYESTDRHTIESHECTPLQSLSLIFCLHVILIN